MHVPGVVSGDNDTAVGQDDAEFFASYPGYNVAPTQPSALPWLKAWLTGNIRTLVKRINGLKPKHRNSAADHTHRFPGVTVLELNARIARFGAEIERFGSVRVEARSPYIFRIYNLEAATRSAGSRASPTRATSWLRHGNQGAGH